MRTAAQLGSIDIARDGLGAGIWRGHTVTTMEGGASGVLHVQLTRLDRRADSPPLRHGRKVWLHHGTASHEARVYLAGTRELAPGTSGIGELRTRTPVFAFAGDRFVLRDFSRRHTLAGGLVLEPAARPRVWKQPRWLHSLQLRAAHPDNVSVWVEDVLERDGCFQQDGLFAHSLFTPPASRPPPPLFLTKSSVAAGSSPPNAGTPHSPQRRKSFTRITASALESRG
jgi:hypothetical protein